MAELEIKTAAMKSDLRQIALEAVRWEIPHCKTFEKVCKSGGIAFAEEPHVHEAIDVTYGQCNVFPNRQRVWVKKGQMCVVLGSHPHQRYEIFNIRELMDEVEQKPHQPSLL